MSRHHKDHCRREDEYRRRERCGWEGHSRRDHCGREDGHRRDRCGMYLAIPVSPPYGTPMPRMGVMPPRCPMMPMEDDMNF